MNLAMSKQQREAFLAETRVGILSVAENGRGPLTVPVWYDYEPGGAVRIVTGAKAKKLALLRGVSRASLCVQTETPPYLYVSVEGPVDVGEPDVERDIRRVALRYLGEQMGEMYLQMTANDHIGAVLLSLKPERWLTADFNKMV